MKANTVSKTTSNFSVIKATHSISSQGTGLQGLCEWRESIYSRSVINGATLQRNKHNITRSHMTAQTDQLLVDLQTLWLSDTYFLRVHYEARERSEFSSWTGRMSAAMKAPDDSLWNKEHHWACAVCVSPSRLLCGMTSPKCVLEEDWVTVCGFTFEYNVSNRVDLLLYWLNCD